MPELIDFRLGRDDRNLAFPAGDIIVPSEFVNVYVLGTATEQSVTVPDGARVAIFNSTANFYANWQTTASVPSGNVTDGSGAELNPVAREVSGLSSFSLIAPAACIVTIAYYS